MRARSINRQVQSSVSAAIRLDVPPFVVMEYIGAQAGNFPRLLLEFVINLTNDISTSPVRLNGMKISHLWNTPRQVK